MEVTRAQLERPAAIHVALAHQLDEVGEHALRVRRVGHHDLQPEALAHSAVLAIEHQHERGVVVVQEPEAGLNAGDALVLAERHGHVLERAQLELGVPSALPGPAPPALPGSPR